MDTVRSHVVAADVESVVACVRLTDRFSIADQPT
jgi:hypothetical protein